MILHYTLVDWDAAEQADAAVLLINTAAAAQCDFVPPAGMVGIQDCKRKI
jgi:hypothetical protein